MNEPGDVTLILKDATSGSSDAMEQLLPIVYDQLRRLAQSKLNSEREGHTLQATALVHEAWVRLIDQKRTDWQDRGHFFAIAAQAIRRILVDHARRRNRVKRGGGAAHVTLDAKLGASVEQPGLEILALDEALKELARESPEKAHVVELRFFAGLSSKEIAEHLGITERTVRRYWAYSQAWLYRRLSGTD
ncbi:MAG: sigma-70 family RNA polymerase sigma factor [Candidatus Eisenbacteria bacterium]|uniref:Sigma-70 family RNA polymerase sigma factor n=1 Tax=Eiseniibacteriota bacterium TaxID=2212470 RepID=A0A956SDQ9_UNCEI|nr:sigma-70 family RNA polymerase sigma factor [Candidatus Eisenbacteria bacterium]